MSTDDRMARLTELARKAWDNSGVGVQHVERGMRARIVNRHGASLLEVHEHPRALDALEAALRVLAGEVREVPTGRGPETLRLRIGYERGLKRIAELEMELRDARAEIDRLTREASFP